jgi:hypothetical protein
MTAGVPGAGIGGLFYLAAALVAPAWDGWRTLVRRDRRVHRPWFVARLAVLALLMLGGIVAAGWLLGLVLTSPSLLAQGARAPAAGGATPQFIARAAVLLTVGTLVAVLAGVEVLRLALRLQSRRARARRVQESR